MNLILKIEAKLASFEENLLCIIMFIMILFSIIQIVLRNIFNSALVDADMFIRSLVLWLGFLGANLAVRRNKHINIDLFSKIITNQKIVKYRFMILNVFSFFISLFLFYLSIEYFRLELENNMNAFYGVKTYYVFMIIPFSFLIMAFRFCLQIFLNKTIEVAD